MSNILMASEDGPNCGEVQRTTVTSSLIMKRDRLKSQLEQIENVLSIVEKHPEIQEVFDAVSSIRGIL